MAVPELSFAKAVIYNTQTSIVSEAETYLACILFVIQSRLGLGGEVELGGDFNIL